MIKDSKSVIEDINELYTIIKPEGLDQYKQTYKLSIKKKNVLKNYLNYCKELLTKDIETKIKQLEGEELIKYIKALNDKRNWRSLAIIENNYKKLCKQEQDSNWFGMVLLVGLRYYEITYNVTIIKEEDFK